MQFRPFRNSDPPRIARLWSAQPPQRGLAQHVTARVLETYVFAKPYFNREDFIIAEDGDELVGFAHVGFGPNDARDDVATEMGAICMLMVDPTRDFAKNAAELLAKAELRLKQRGAKLLYGGSIPPLNPYYLGLYGGSELPGVLLSDHRLVELYNRSGYREIDRTVILQRELGEFRPPIDRRMVQLKRSMVVEVDAVPNQGDWWDACVSPPHEPTRFEILPKNGGSPCGSVRFWVIEPFSNTWGRLSVGLTKLYIEEEQRGRGLATYLNSEALRHLQLNGVQLVEAQTMLHNKAALDLYARLGFDEVDQGVVFRKEA